MIAIFPEIASRAAAGDCESLAISIRKYFGGAEVESPKPNLRTVLTNVGIRIESLTMEGHGALLAKDDRGAFEIVALIQSGQDPLAERFLLAHMLGHFLFDVQPLIARSDWTVSGYQEPVCPLKRYSNGFVSTDLSAGDIRKEEKADDFAAALLMPRGMVRRAMERKLDHEAVAALFGVTRACLTRRLQQLSGAGDVPANFLGAEIRIRSASRPDSASKPRSDLDPAAILQAPELGGTKRTGAKAAYSAIDKNPRAQATAGAQAAATKAAAAVVDAAPEATLRKGMDRIREIAKLLDKGQGK